MNRQQYLNDISQYLANVAMQVTIKNAIKLIDINVVAEDFYKGFLNLAYGLDLENLNVTEPNAKAIDLGDKVNRVSIQVTSEKTIAKIRDTVQKFEEAKKELEYDKLTILILREKSRYRELPQTNPYTLEVIDYKDLIQHTKNLSTDKLKEIVEYLKGELETGVAHRKIADERIIEAFAENASAYISEVAERISASIEDEIADVGLNQESLFEKFQNMKCSPSYRKHFDRCALYFSNVREVMETDSVEGGADTIRAIVNLIMNLYISVLDDYKNGDQIHAAIQCSLIQGIVSPQEQIATEVFIFYTINECGIFNEKK